MALILEGLPAAAFSLVIFFWLPERPNEANWLSEEEKAWLKAKTAFPLGADTGPAKPSIASVLSRPSVLLLGLANALFLGTGYAFTLTAPQVLGLRAGLSPAVTGYVMTAAGLVGAVAMLANGRHADRRGEHFWHVILPFGLVAVGLAVLALSTTFLTATTGYVLYAIGLYAGAGVFPLLISRLLEGPPLVVGVAGANMIGQLGSFVLPSLYGLAQHRAGRLDGALWTLPLPFLLAATTVGVLWYGNRPRKTGRMLAAS